MDYIKFNGSVIVNNEFVINLSSGLSLCRYMFTNVLEDHIASNFMKLKAVCSYEMLVNMYQTTQCQPTSLQHKEIFTTVKTLNILNLTVVRNCHCLFLGTIAIFGGALYKKWIPKS
jgi:hypothetical protein